MRERSVAVLVQSAAHKHGPAAIERIENEQGDM
jgi:hypothetical protein